MIMPHDFMTVPTGGGWRHVAAHKDIIATTATVITLIMEQLFVVRNFMMETRFLHRRAVDYIAIDTDTQQYNSIHVRISVFGHLNIVSR